MPLSINENDQIGSIDVINEETEYFEVSVIHQGRDSIVFLATNIEPKNEASASAYSDRIVYYAIKKITLGGTFSDNILSRLSNLSKDTNRRFLYCEREIKTLRTLRGHPNIVELLGVTRTDCTCNLVFVYCKTTLWSLIHAEKWFRFGGSENAEQILNFNKIRECSKMILQGLAHCHAHSIVHRDLKPSNILMDQQCVFKLADFGQARTITMDSSGDQDRDKDNMKQRQLLTGLVGTRNYKSPELLYGSINYNNSVDMWSFGCVLAEICLGRLLFPGNSDIEQLMLIVEAIGEAPSSNFNGSQMVDYNKIIIESARSREESVENLKKNILMPMIGHNNCVDLITNMCTYENRLNVEQALGHDFFSE